MTTTSEAGEAVVLKTDSVGRVKMPAEQRERLLDEFESSGLSGTKFAALAGIKYQTFATWAQRRRKQRSAGGAAKVPAPSADQVRWLEAVLEQAQPPERSCTTAVLVQLPGGARLEITDKPQALLTAALLRALEHLATCANVSTACSPGDRAVGRGPAHGRIVRVHHQPAARACFIMHLSYGNPGSYSVFSFCNVTNFLTLYFSPNWRRKVLGRLTGLASYFVAE